MSQNILYLVNVLYSFEKKSLFNGYWGEYSININ